MTRYSLSNESDILNRLDVMKDGLYRGNVNKEDLAFSIKTIKNLLLELYLVKQELSPEQDKSVDEQMVAKLSNAASSMFEANKPM